MREKTKYSSFLALLFINKATFYTEHRVGFKLMRS